MRIATCEQCQKIDQSSQDDFLLPAEVLMESAGSSAAREIDQSFLPELTRGSVGIICGPGNNGGDGMVVARHLHSMGHRDLILFVMAKEDSQSELYKKQLKRVNCQGIRIVDLWNQPEDTSLFKGLELIVDALFGIGLSRTVEEPYSQILEAMNSTRCSKVSLDIPSGLDGDRGTVKGIAFTADQTLSFGIAKPGFFVSEGPSHVGRLRVLPIGFPYELLRKVPTSHFAFGEKLAKRYLPKRPNSGNKSSFGHLMLIAGSPGKWGAGLLGATAAFRIGSGYVSLVSFEDPQKVINEQPEIMTNTWGASDLFKKMPSAFAVGPGLGVSEKTKEVIEHLLNSGAESVILDADAISTCVKYNLFPLPKSWVLTPHAGELSRILDVESREIEQDRYRYALLAAEKTGCHVLLKGFRSVLAYEDRCMVIVAGNSALAKAGSGDILTGMIGGLLAQGLPPVQGTATASYLHGRMADEWIRSGKHKSSLLPSDLSTHLPSIMERLSGGALL
jgi:NAD(P)H-hydrate epimerase